MDSQRRRMRSKVIIMLCGNTLYHLDGVIFRTPTIGAGRRGPILSPPASDFSGLNRSPTFLLPLLLPLLSFPSPVIPLYLIYCLTACTTDNLCHPFSSILGAWIVYIILLFKPTTFPLGGDYVKYQCPAIAPPPLPPRIGYNVHSSHRRSTLFSWPLSCPSAEP